MLDLQLLISSAGKSAVCKAEKLSELKKVSVINQTTDKIVARVKGTSTYSVQLAIVDNRVDRGSCNCMAFRSNTFCKHCVAVGLTVNHLGVGSAQDKSELSSDEVLISRYLAKQTKQELVSQLINIANKDNNLFEQLRIKAQFALNPPKDKDIKKLFTKALPNRQLWELSKVAAYFKHAEGAFEGILELMQALSIEKQIQLLEKFLERLNLVMGKVDDSYGARFELEYAIKSAFNVALNKVDWTAKQKGTWLYKQFNQRADISLNIPNDFTLSKPEYEAFLQCCAIDFEDYTVDSDIRKRERNFNLYLLSQPLLTHAKEVGDIYAQVKILSKTASSLNDLLDICQLYLQQNDEISADDWLLKAKSLIKTPLEQRYWLKSAIEVALAEKDKVKARNLVWRMFDGHPTFSEFIRLEKVANLTTPLTSIELEKVERCFIEQYHQAVSVKGSNVSNALDYYLHLNLQDKAIDWAINNKAETFRLLTLGHQINKTQPNNAVSFYGRAIGAIVKQATNSAYADAVEHLKEIANTWAKGSEYQQYFTQLLALLIEKHKSKRNLMNLIAVNFSQYLH